MIETLINIIMAPCASEPVCTPLLGFAIASTIVAHVLFATSYLAIFVMLLLIGRRRADVLRFEAYRIVLLLVLAGALAAVVRLSYFRQDAVLLASMGRLVPALVTAVLTLLFWRLLPWMTTLPSSAQLRETNEALRQEMAERRAGEASLLQSSKMEAIGRIAGGLAHDYNNMLQVISGNVRLIALRCDDSPEMTALADAVDDAVGRGVLLTARLLSFSQEQNILLEPVDIADFARSLPERIAGALPPRITLEIVGGDLDASVLADATQLELAILNIVSNSCEAMPDGGDLRISFSRHEASGRSDLSDGGYLRITVADTGLGMAPSVADRAFDPFFSTKPTEMASGLGLPMVFAMAQRSGGTATIESRPGEGTTVSIYLKLTPVDVEAQDHAPPEASDDFAGRSVLLVDDEAATRSVVALTLESLGCTVATAANGLEALALTETTWPDLFLLDYAMPTMNGAELAQRLRARDPSGCIMFLTGFADFAAIRAVVGADAIILQKPISRAGLADALTKAFSGTGADRRDR